MWFAWPGLTRRTIAARLRRLAAAGRLGQTGPTVLTWDESGITESAQGREVRVGWECVEWVEKTTDHFFVFVGELHALVVPRRGDLAAAEEFAAQAGLRSAR